MYFGTAIGVYKAEDGVLLWEIKFNNEDEYDFNKKEILEARDDYQ